MNLFFISIGGFFGAILRFAISEQIKAFYATLIANITGSILLALSLLAYLQGKMTESIYLMLAIGFSGALTTFSSFSYEVFILLKEGRIPTAIFYMLGSISLSLAIVYLILRSTLQL